MIKKEVKIRKNSVYKALGYIFLIGVMILLNLTFVFAEELIQFDNRVDYNSLTQTATIVNTFGLGRTIAKVKLNTPLVYQVPRGYQKVGEFQITSLEDYNNAFEKISFYNVKDLTKEIQRTYDYKIKSYELVNVEDYKKECSDFIEKNGTKTNLCYNVLSGSHEEQKEVWTPLEKADFIKGEIVTIGIFTDVKEGDKVEWIPEYYGVKINEFAVWEESLKVGLVFHFSYEDASGYRVTNNATSGGYGYIWGNNASAFRTGKYGLGYAYFPTQNNITYSNITGSNIAGDITLCSWVKITAKGYIYFMSDWTGNYFWGTYSDGLKQRYYNGGIEAPELVSTNNVFNNTWSYICMRRQFVPSLNKNNVTLWLNGKIDGTELYTNNGTAGSVRTIGTTDASSWNINGTIDETSGWNRSLSDSEMAVLPLRNWNEVSPTNPTITLNSPIDYYNSTNQTIIFNISALNYNSGGGIANVTLNLDGIVNQTDTSGVNGTYLFTKILSEGNHNWSILVYNNNSMSNQSAMRFLSIDKTYPTINITYPTNTTYTDGIVTADNKSIWFNWTAIDTNRELCWYSKDNGVTNKTITCNANDSFYSTYGTKTLIAWVNDSFGLLTSSRVTATWVYTLLENSRTIPTTAIEGTTKTFILNLTTNTPVTSAYLNYNGTRYSTSINAGTYTTITTIMAIPLVNANGNATIFWELSGEINTTSSNMNVTNIAIDNCTDNTIVVYNFTMVDEILQTKLTNTNASLNLQIYPTTSTTEIINYSHQYDAVNSFAVCINNSLAVGDSFTINAEIEYIADNHSSEFYHIQKENLSSAYYRNITLYDLDSTHATTFKIIYRDPTYIAIEDALIQIQRKYISEGVFKISEIPITDYNGETFASLQTDNVVYTFVVIKNGIVLDTFSNLFVKCSNILIEECTISLNSISPYVVPDDYTIGDDFNFDITYNRTNRLLSATFSIPSGNSSTIILNSTLTDNIGTIVACSDSLTSSSGTLSCTIPNGIGNQSVIAYIYKDNVLQGYSIANNKQKASDIYGGSLVFLLLFLYLTLIGISIGDNPMITGIFLVIGIVLGIALNLVNGSFIGRSATILWLVIAVVIVLIKGGKRT